MTSPARIVATLLAGASLLTLTPFGCAEKTVGSPVAGQPDAGEDAPPDVQVPSEASHDEEGGGSGGNDGGAPDGSIPRWDPEWAGGPAFDWPMVSNAPVPDCGPGCQVVASPFPDTFPNRAPKATDRWVVLAGWLSGEFGVGHLSIIAADLAVLPERRALLVDDATWLPQSWGAGAPAVDGDIAMYVVGSKYDGYVVMRHLVTGERKLVWRMPMESAKTGGHPGVSATALALPYAYWRYSGDLPDSLFRFDTRDGSLKASMKVGQCEIISGTSTGLGACASAGVGLFVVDFDKDTAYRLTDTPYRETNGMVSQDGREAIWIDFRDPGTNDEHGSYDNPWGGEVYHHDLTTSDLSRLTFDTPNQPTLKTSPWVHDGMAAWVTYAEKTNPNPTGSSVYWYGAGRIMAQRQGGPVEKVGPPRCGLPKPTNRGIVSIWIDDDGNGWTVLLDWPGTSEAGQ